MAESAAVAALRARIRELEGVRVQARRLPSGVSALDALIGGLPTPGLLELCGPVGSGRSRLALALAVAAQREHAAEIAWIDAQRRFYPPAAALAGVDLRRLLLVRPPGEHLLWATEQVIRAGCFRLVVIADPDGILGAPGNSPPRGRPGGAGASGQRWARAAEAGDCPVVVLTERPARQLPAEVRVMVGPSGLAVARDRGGVDGGLGPSAPAPAGIDPWAIPSWRPLGDGANLGVGGRA